MLIIFIATDLIYTSDCTCLCNFGNEETLNKKLFEKCISLKRVVKNFQIQNEDLKITLSLSTIAYMSYVEKNVYSCQIHFTPNFISHLTKRTIIDSCFT